MFSYIVTAVTSFTIGYLLKYVGPKPKVVYWSPHSVHWQPAPNNQPIELRTDIWAIQNIGRGKASGVEVIFQTRPDYYQLWPAVNPETNTLDNGNFVLSLRELGPKELVTISILSYQQLPNLLTIRSESGAADPITMLLQKQPSKLALFTLLALAFIGLITVLTAIGWGLLQVDKLALFQE